MKADSRISVKDYSRQKNLKVELARVPFARQFRVRMNGAKWPADGETVGAVDAALSANEPRLKAVAEKLSGWNSARSALRTLANRVDKNNKRWYEAWSGNYAPGSPEHDTLSQINTESGDTEPPGPVTFSVMYDGENDEFHIDAEAEHATKFRVLRKGPGEPDFIERASNAESPIHDPVTLPGVYEIKLQARNSTADGPLSAAQNGTVPG